MTIFHNLVECRKKSWDLIALYTDASVYNIESEIPMIYKSFHFDITALSVLKWVRNEVYQDLLEAVLIRPDGLWKLLMKVEAEGETLALCLEVEEIKAIIQEVADWDTIGHVEDKLLGLILGKVKNVIDKVHH
jgi:hypothetical protein